MSKLQVVNTHFITYKGDSLTFDVLGGVDMLQMERLVCTLRISFGNYPPSRTTLDLYSDNQTDKLIRTLCDKWEIKLIEVSKDIYALTLQLEEYRLEALRYGVKNSKKPFEPNEQESKQAIQFLKSKNLLPSLTQSLNRTGILGEDENAVILFLALASHKYTNPFSVLCLAKSGIGKSYILQKLSACMPDNSYSFHSQISANALYYFNSGELHNKALLVEDLEWTSQMLTPLASLQSQGRLVKTRATKDKDGMLHSTTFEVNANLCLVACAYCDKNLEEMGLPFLCLHLNHTQAQDLAIMDYQKRCKTGEIKTHHIQAEQHHLKCVMSVLKNVSIINPYATLLQLPEQVAHPRKSLLLLLNFIDVITYFHQYQREQIVDEETGEISIKTDIQDIELAFGFLKNSLFRRADELSSATRGFYNWLTAFLTEAKTNSFTALDLRRAKAIHPRTLNRYLQELKLFCYIQVTGGNKHREGFVYKLTHLGSQTDTQSKIEQQIQANLQAIRESQTGKSQVPKQEQAKPKQEPQAPIVLANTQPKQEQQAEPKQEPTFFEPHYKRRRINEKEEYTFKFLLELEAKEQGREYLAEHLTAITKRSKCIESRYLKTLWEQGKLNRRWEKRQYYYSLVGEHSRTTPNSTTVSQNTPTNPESHN